MRISELSTSFANAQTIFRRLKSKYPTLDAYIVLATQYGQTEPAPDGLRFLQHIPSSFVDSAERREALILFDVFKEISRRNEHLKNPYLIEQTERFKVRLLDLTGRMELVESTQLQLRFGELDYDLISQLQVDPLIDQSLTPNTRASIKVTLGTIGSLRRKQVGSFDLPKESFDVLKPTRTMGR